MPLLLAAGGLLHGLTLPAQAIQLVPAKAAPAAAPQVVPDATTNGAGDRINALERQVQSALEQARRQQDELGQLRRQLAVAESANAWLPWLILALALAGGVIAWLALRGRRMQFEQPRWSGPRSDADVAAAGAGPTTAAPRPPGAAAAHWRPGADLGKSAQARAPLLPSAAGLPAMTPKPAQPLPAGRDVSMGTDVPPRPVSVEELLDLEQQVEFFLVLGQAQSAIDLLLNHVRATGGINALPYFKLLEIYRQQGDEEAYERTRERFNQRFNAHAPDWASDLAAGRSLEDYANVIARLQRAWSQPVRAAAELDALLLRRADLEPFDLPAYRDLLMLHALVLDLPAVPVDSVAAELPQPAGPAARPGDGVDVLLPLDEGPLEITTPWPHVAHRTGAKAMLADWVFTRATLPSDAEPLDRHESPSPALRGEAWIPARPPIAVPSAAGPLDLDLNLELGDPPPAPRDFTHPAAFTDLDLRRDSRLQDLPDLPDLPVDSLDADSAKSHSRH